MISIFCGCSYTEGIGLDNISNDKNLWVNILHSSLLPFTDLHNFGKGGSTNQEIFFTACASLSKRPKYLFVCWTELLRYRINPSVEIYKTDMLWCQNRNTSYDININPNIIFTKKYIENIKNRFFDLQHPHYKIVEILKYSSVLHSLAALTNTKVFFINNLIGIDKNYFNHVINLERTPADTTSITQDILNASTRDDEEYFQIYDKIHSDYAETQGLSSNWVNIDESFRNYFFVDKGNDNLHPGVHSNKLYANFLINKLKNKI